MFFLLLLTTFPKYCNGYANWIYPGDWDNYLVFNYIDTVYFTWTSNISHPLMNLWCLPTATSAQPFTNVYHLEVSTNGTSPQSFPYTDYYHDGKCHMQVGNFAGDDGNNSEVFYIVSNDAVSPQTWGLSALGQLDGSYSSTTVQSSSSTEASLIAPPSSSSISLDPIPISTSSSLDFSILSHSPSSYSTKVSSTASPAPKSTRAAITTTAARTTSPATTTSAKPPPHSPTSPPSTLNAAAKAGISIGSAFCALALIIIVLLCRNAWSNRTTDREKIEVHTSEQSPWQYVPNVSEVGEGAYTEVNGIPRPTELQGIPRVELE